MHPPPSSAPLLTLDRASLFIPGDKSRRLVLQDICWQVQRGGHCALLGDNGSGKSTLLRLMRGELWPASGTIVWHTAQGDETSPLAGRAMTALVAPALQETWQRQGWDIAGRDILLTGLADTPLLYNRPPAAWEAAAETLARRLKAQDLLQRSLPTLSQGQLRILLLGRALLRAPRLLLLDEYADGLDSAHRTALLETLEEHAQSTTMICTAHRAGHVLPWCRERHYLAGGRLYNAPPQGRANTSDSPGPTASPGAQGAAHSHRFASAAASADGAVSVSIPTAQPLLQLERATVYIDRQRVLRDITWNLHYGEHWRIRGANGSGKSTLLRLLAGDGFVAAGGSLRHWLPGQGGPVRELAQIRRGVRLVSDLGQALYGYPLTALELVCSGHDNSVGVYRSFSPAEEEEALAAMRRMLGEEEARQLAGTSIRMLSSGQLRRLFLARALMGRPDILLLDEPCSNLDAASRTQLLALLDGLAAEGLHLVFVSHNDADAPRCINREACMRDGCLHIVR